MSKDQLAAIKAALLDPTFPCPGENCPNRVRLWIEVDYACDGMEPYEAGHFVEGCAEHDEQSNADNSWAAHWVYLQHLERKRLAAILEIQIDIPWAT